MQEILLDLLDDRTIKRLGECVRRPVDVRMVFATNASLEQAVKDGAFRADLYDRIGRHDSATRGRRRGNWRVLVPATLAKYNGNKTKAAQELQISRKTLYEHLRSATA